VATGKTWKGPYWQARKRMENTGLERTDRQGVAGTEWRMQIGGERLGRAGIEVAGTERKARTGAEKNGMVSRGKGYGGQRHGGDYEGTAGTESSGGSWSGLESPVLDRSGKAGKE